jgi:DNA topoisomerase-1
LATRRRGGWRRRGSRRSFRYDDARGRRVTDREQLERIAALRIPPAWREVWISPNPRAKLQATGLDAAGRRQYLYHPSFRAAQERAKFERLVSFGERLPAFRKAMSEDMELEPDARDRVCALAARLVNEAWFRVGSERYARSSQTFGITTLRKRHVQVRGSRISFRFRAKHGAVVRTTLVDDELADAIRELLDLPGDSRVFRYRNGDGLATLTGAVLNEYVRRELGEDFTTKDFRTWGGTLAAAVALAERGPAETDADAKRAVAAAMRTAGTLLGNTPSVARSFYVSPAVVEEYREGRTLEDFRPRNLRLVRARATGLDPEERALLALLRACRKRKSRSRAAA